jgi:hypothetical protein
MQNRPLVLAALVAVLSGCVSVETQGAGGEGGGACCLAEPVCPATAHEVAACETSDCFPVEACCSEKLCEPGTCEAPTCASYESEVGSCDGLPSSECRAVVICDSTIYCHAESFCEAVPMCDEGDVEQPSGSCPSGDICYAVDLCGSSVLCSDFGVQHGCPAEAPVEAEPCNFPGISCDYPTGVDDCVETWFCGDPPQPRAPIPSGGLEWHLIADSCAVAP